MDHPVHLSNLKVLDITLTKVNWSKLDQPKDHPVTRLFAAGCYIYHSVKFDDTDDDSDDDSD